MRAKLFAILALAIAPSLALAQAPLEALPSILQLQLDQRPAWRAYTDAIAATRAEQSHSAAETARLNILTTPERLEATRAQLKSQAAAFEQQASATTAFYAVLSPEQRRVFDDVTRVPTPPSPMRAYARPQQPTGQQMLAPPPPGAGLPAPAR